VIVTYEGRLTLDQLAKLLKALVDHSYKYPQITQVKELLTEAAGDHGVVLTEEQREQVYGALYTAMPTGAVRSGDEWAAVQAHVVTSLGRDPRALYELLMQAWQLVIAREKEQPAESALVEERDGLLVPDPRDKDLDGLGIADVFFLVTHDPHDGRPLLAAPVLACGTAAALLAELLVHDLVSLDLGTHEVKAAEALVGVPELSATARQALEVIQDGGSATLGHWLSALAANGHRAVQTHLRQEGIVTREERGRFQKKACFVPVDPQIVDSIFRAATFRLRVGRWPDAPYAVLIELARVTGLTANRYSSWWEVHRIDPGGALVEVPGRERIDLLFALTKAAITELLSSPGL
jgi:Golgi phosphoprotein 3 (GPP34)